MKRTPIERKTPLQRTRSPLRRSGLAPVSRQRRRSMTRYAADRAFVADRAGGLCERCGHPGTDCHHRAGRGQHMHNRDLMVWLCRPCHDRTHAEPAESYRLGWLVRRNQNPASDGGTNAEGPDAPRLHSVCESDHPLTRGMSSSQQGPRPGVETGEGA